MMLPYSTKWESLNGVRIHLNVKLTMYLLHHLPNICFSILTWVALIQIHEKVCVVINGSEKWERVEAL